MSEDLRAKAVAVVEARDTAAEARQEVASIIASHEDAWNARTAAIKAEEAAESEARAAIKAHVEASGEKLTNASPAWGLYCDVTMEPEYDDELALDWLLANTAQTDVHLWLHEAIERDRKRFEALLKERGALFFARYKRVLVPKIVNAERLPGAIHASDDIEREGAAEATDAVADLAHRVAGA